MIHFGFDVDAYKMNNKICPIDYCGLQDAESMDVLYNNNRFIKVQTRICPICNRRFISINSFPDLQIIGINNKDYINLNLPDGVSRKQIGNKQNTISPSKIKPEKSLEEKILDALKEYQPIRPKNLSRIIKEDRHEVKNCLYEMRGINAYRDEEFYWWIKDTSLEWTHGKIYYLASYVASRYWKYRNDDDSDVYDSKLIVSFKNGADHAIEQVSTRMLSAVNELIENYVSSEYLILAPIPSSKLRKMTNMYRAAEFIGESCCHRGDVEVLEMFERIYDMPAAHEGDRPGYDDQKNSIRCNYPELCNENYTCIILDDVTTTGTIMDVCKDILIENGMPEENILRLAFAKTGE